MTPSIRTFLLINLLLSVTLIISLVIITNLFFAHKEIQVQLDRQLVNTVNQVQAFLSDYRTHPQRDFNLIQSKLSKSLPLLHKEDACFIRFQVWDQHGRLLLHSSNLLSAPLPINKPGLSNLWLKGKPWRVNILFDPNTQLTFLAADDISCRKNLESLLTRDALYIMLIAYPFLGILIWIIVGCALDTVQRVTQEVRHRAPGHLQPVNLESVPTEIKPLVIELNHLFTCLQEAFEREKRFTADAAHELRTPLAALHTHTQVALRAETTEERQTALFKVLACIHRSTHVIQQLLTLSRITPEATLHEMTPVDLSKEAAEIAAQLAPEAISKNIDLELVTPERPVVILGHTVAIGILIRNLVDNAIRYSPENSKVVIEIKKEQNAIYLQVTDNGPGIPVELRERVFERFFRVVGNQAAGSGLGLSIVAQIAKLHQARIVLNTAHDGHGLEFQIIFNVPPGRTSTQA